MSMIKGVAKCSKILFEKDGFVISVFTPIGEVSGSTDKLKKFTMKGKYYAKEGEEYTIHGELDAKSKYPDSYNAIRVAQEIDLSKGDRASMEIFLKSIISESRAKALLDTLDNPFEALEQQDVLKLSTVKGIGTATAEKIIRKYMSNKDYSIAYIALSKYGLTTKAIQKICDSYGSPEKAIEAIQENPYVLTDVDGFGFTKADNVFLNMYDNPTDHRRVEAYIKYMFEKEEEEGNSWMSPQKFINKLREFIPNADLVYAVEHIKNSDEYVYINDGEDKRIATTEAYDLETEIVKELKRLMSNPATMKLNNYEKQVSNIEKVNGWQYSKEQREAIDNMVEQNVYMLQGLAGTGKSSVVSAFLSAVESAGYSYSQCALSGRASDNLTKVTGKQGYTIHSLLGFNHEKGGFAHDKSTPLPANVVVIDELSMVSASIFLPLLRAIKTGSKLIMIGDYGQLESIGVGVMGGLIRGKKIPMTLLKKIHRQAQDSAIITHSIKVRNGLKPEELALKAGRNDIYGAKKDLEYIVLDNDNESSIVSQSIAKFKEALNTFDIQDIQIISSTKATIFELNKLAQMVHNPMSLENSIELGFKDAKYTVKVNDKVINMKNNKNTLSTAGVPTPIFNGNTGIVKEINNTADGDQLIIHFDGIGEVVVEGDALKNIELGYAITVHKSQGSTIKCVIFALPFHYLLNTKELVYTGMTRASNYQVIITSPRSFQRAIKNTSVSKKKTFIEYLYNNKGVDMVG